MQVTKEELHAQLEFVTDKFFRDMLDPSKHPFVPAFEPSLKAALLRLRPALKLAVKAGFVGAVDFLVNSPKDCA